MQNAVSTEVLLTPRDAGKRLGITTGRVIQLTREGRLQELRDSGNRRLFAPAEVERCRQVREAARKAAHK